MYVEVNTHGIRLQEWTAGSRSFLLGLDKSLYVNNNAKGCLDENGLGREEVSAASMSLSNPF